MINQSEYNDINVSFPDSFLEVVNKTIDETLPKCFNENYEIIGLPVFCLPPRKGGHKKHCFYAENNTTQIQENTPTRNNTPQRDTTHPNTQRKAETDYASQKCKALCGLPFF